VMSELAYNRGGMLLSSVKTAFKSVQLPPPLPNPSIQIGELSLNLAVDTLLL
jgi:hypothetical protein